MGKRYEAVNIKFEPAFAFELRATAERDGRTLTGLVRHILTLWLTERRPPMTKTRRAKAGREASTAARPEAAKPSATA